MLIENLEFYISLLGARNRQTAISNTSFSIQHSKVSISRHVSLIAAVYESRTCIEAGRSDRSIPARGHQ